MASTPTQEPDQTHDRQDPPEARASPDGGLKKSARCLLCLRTLRDKTHSGVLDLFRRADEVPMIHPRDQAQKAAPEVNELVDDYLRILQAYAVGRQSVATAGLFRARTNPKTVVKQLDEVDARRIALRGPTSKSDESP